jgi:hypothetical protein
VTNKLMVGTHRDKLDKDRIRVTTFHPFKDVWWAVYDTDKEFLVLTITNKVVTASEPFKDLWTAHERFSYLVDTKHDRKR